MTLPHPETGDCKRQRRLGASFDIELRAEGTAALQKFRATSPVDGPLPHLPAVLLSLLATRSTLSPGFHQAVCQGLPMSKWGRGGGGCLRLTLGGPLAGTGPVLAAARLTMRCLSRVTSTRRSALCEHWTR